MKRLLSSLVLALCVTFSVAPAPAVAQNWAPADARDAVRKGDIVPLRTIFARLKREYGGYQGQNATLNSRSNGTPTYRIDWITRDGRKLKIVVNARSGQTIRVRGG